MAESGGKQDGPGRETVTELKGCTTIREPR